MSEYIKRRAVVLFLVAGENGDDGLVPLDFEALEQLGTDYEVAMMPCAAKVLRKRLEHYRELEISELDEYVERPTDRLLKLF
jgi:hypothetical protein